MKNVVLRVVDTIQDHLLALVEKKMTFPRRKKYLLTYEEIALPMGIMYVIKIFFFEF